MVDDVVDVKLVQQGVAVLRNRCREHDDLVQLTDALQEGVNAWSLDDIDVVRLSFNLDGNGEVGLV